jgi:hypothetical protein
VSVPLPACPGCFRVAGAGPTRGVGVVVCWFPRVRGRRGMRVGCGARSAPSGRGKAGGGPGEPGNRALGGFRVPPVLAVSTGRRCGAVCAHCRSTAPGAVSTVTRTGSACNFRPHPSGGPPVLPCTFHGHWCDRVHRQGGSGLVSPGVCLLAE